MSNYIFPGQNDCNCSDPISDSCQNCEENLGCAHPIDFNCSTYSGANLTCIGVNTNDKGDVVLQKINDTICNIVVGEADYSQYNTYCLAPVSTQQQFVEKISNQFCTLQSNYNTFVTETYVDEIDSIYDRIVILEVPEITGNSCLTLLANDTQKQVLQKIANKIGDLCTVTSLSAVNWNQCYTVSPIPTTVGEGFNTLISQICDLSTQISNIAAPTYLVKTNNLDNTPGTLNDKILTSGCITKSVVTDSGQQKLQIGLSFTPSSYTFNAGHFDVTPTGTSGCQNTFNISLNPDILAGLGDVNCETMGNIFQPDANPGVILDSIYGATTADGCIAANNCQVMQMLFSSYSDGNYIIAIDTVGAENLCDQYKLIEFDTEAVTSVGLAQTNTTIFSITNTPITTTGNLGLGLATQTANTIFAGPSTGIPAVPTFRTMVTADIPDQTVTYPKIQNVTSKRLLGRGTPSTGVVQEITIGSNLALSDAGVLSATAGGYTPNPCWLSAYTGFTLTLPASGNNGADIDYTFTNYTTQVSSLLNTRASVATPSWRFDAAGNLDLLGVVTLRLTAATTQIDQDIIIPFADVSDFFDNGCTIMNKFINKYIGTQIVTVSPTEFAFVEVYLCLDISSNPESLDLLLKVKSGVKITDLPLTISLDGVIIPLDDNN